MKLAIALFFLCALPIKVESSKSVDERSAINGKFDTYVEMVQDITRVELDFQKHRFLALEKQNFVSKQKDWPLNYFKYNDGPVIRARTSIQYNAEEFPARDDMRRELPYAILPNSISFPDIKKRMLEPLVLKRNGRKEEDRSYNYA